MNNPKTYSIGAALLFTVFLLLLPLHLFAQDAAGSAASSGITADNIVTWLTPIIVPLLIAFVKKVTPSIPSVWLPIIAPVLGFLLTLVNNVASAHSGSLLLGALLGLAGVGIREVKDQILPAAPSA